MTKEKQQQEEERQRAIELTIVYQFLTEHLDGDDRYVPTKQNGRLIADYLRSHNLGFTLENLNAIFFLLKQEGRLSTTPDPEPVPPEDKPKVEVVPSTPWGFSISKQVLRKMSSEELKQHYKARYGQQFRDAVTAVANQK